MVESEPLLEADVLDDEVESAAVLEPEPSLLDVLDVLAVPVVGPLLSLLDVVGPLLCVPVS
ncbi:MAG: hypothetical protein K1X88_30675 [Nannocystaceae bacterium]|nr:hypothetical protein [Nannocystaceae bacterium]